MKKSYAYLGLFGSILVKVIRSAYFNLLAFHFVQKNLVLNCIILNKIHFLSCQTSTNDRSISSWNINTRFRLAIFITSSSDKTVSVVMCSMELKGYSIARSKPYLNWLCPETGNPVFSEKRKIASSCSFV